MKRHTILFALLLAPFCVTELTAQSSQALVESTVTRPVIEGHIYFLASDELRGRQTGSHEIDIAAEYIATTFRRYGVKPVPGAEDGYFQPIPMARISKPSEFRMAYAGSDIDADAVVLITGQDVDASAELVYLGYGLADDFSGAEVSGKIVVVKSGTEDPEEGFLGPGQAKLQRATEAGALGLIELQENETFQWQNVKRYLESERLKVVPPSQGAAGPFHAMLRDYDGGFLGKFENAADPLRVVIGSRVREDLPGRNVVGMVEGTDPDLKDEFVIYSAHYDHIGVGQPNAEGDSIYNGARDNAVGVVTVMAAAENIAKYPTKRSALFILFTGEEMGLIGSRYYTENPLIPMDQMVYCFNSDNGGYNDTSIATIIGLERTTEAAHIKAACEAFGITAIDDPAPEQGLFDRSDNVNFARQGVPAPTFSLGFRAFDQEIMRYYHQQSDNPDNVDYAYLEKFFRAYVLSARLIADDPETPFWIEGDKYFEAGEKLYGR